MSDAAIAVTDRLVLRPWRRADVAPFLAMGRDGEVMRFIGPPMDEDRAQAAVERQTALQAERGHCFWALERRADGAFIGFCGLKPGPPGTPIANEVEIGWRLARAAWGRGYAREAAAASLDWGWRTLAAASIAAITVPANARSRGLMERLGMTRSPGDDFDHPALAEGDQLRRHLVYRIARPAAVSSPATAAGAVR